MATLTRGHTYQTGEVLTAANLNSEFDRILTTINGGLDSDNVNSTSIMTLAEAQTITGNKSFNSNLTIADGTNDLDVVSHDGTNGLKLGGTLVTSTAAELNILDGVTSTAAELNILDGVTSSATEINYVDITATGTAQASKALVTDGSVDIGGINTVTATTFSGSLSGTLASSVTATTQAASTNNTTVATTAFVQQEITSEDLDFTTTTGSGSVDLNSQALAFTPGDGIDITHSGQAVTVAAEEATDSNKGIASFSSSDFSVSSGAVSLVDITASHIAAGTLVTSSEGLATGSDTAIPTTEAVKDYVDTNITAQDLDFSTTTGSGAVDLDSQTLAFTPGEGIDITHSGQAVTVGAEDATDSNKGVASFASADFSVSSGAVSLVDLTTSHIAAATLVTSSDTIAGNDDDATLPTSAAVKAYVDTQILTEDTIAELNDTYIGTLAGGNLLVYDGTDTWDNKVVSGDATLAASGALTLDATNTNLTTLANLTTVGTVATGAWEATDVAVAHGGTGASDASTARTNLGLVIGTDVAAAGANSDITSITGLTTDLAVAHGGTGASTESAARTNLGVAIGSDVQAYDAGLASIAGLTTAADKMVYTTGSDTYAVTALTEIGRNILDDADAAAVRSTIGAQVAGSYQAAGSYAASGSNSDITALTGLSTDLSVAQGGTGASTFTTSGILLGAGTGAVTASAAMTTNGTLLIGGVGGPEVATLTAGSNVTITNGDGTITIASSGGGGGGGASAFTDLSDVGDTTATTGNVMIANGSSWESEPVSGDVSLVASGAMTIADNAVTLAKMAGLARGKIIVGDSSDDPSALAAGSDGQVLTMDSSGDVGWEAAASGGHTIQEEGSSLTARANLNFIGAAVTAADNGSDTTTVTIGAENATLPFTNANGGSDPIALASVAVGQDLVSDTTPQLGGSLDVNGNAIVSTSNANISITPNGSGKVVLDGASWPSGGESEDYVLKTNGSGTLSWAEAASGGHVIQEEGSGLTARANLNFVGTAVTATDNGSDTTIVTVGASNASLPITRSDGSTSDPIALTSAAIGESLVTDTSPQLGGDLDVNGQSIVSASNGNIAITPNGSGNVILDGITWPNSGESANYILKTDGSGALSWVEDAGGIASVAADTSPQLGGNLDVNGQSMVSDSGNENIPITPHGSGSVVISKLSVTGDTSLDGGSFVFNEAGADKDFRVEGDSEENLLFVDASTDRVGIGTATPASHFEVILSPGNYMRLTDPSGSVNASESVLGFYGSSGGATRLGYMGFGSTTHTNMTISNDQSASLDLCTAATMRIRIADDGGVGINEDDPEERLHIKGQLANNNQGWAKIEGTGGGNDHTGWKFKTDAKQFSFAAAHSNSTSVGANRMYWYEDSGGVLMTLTDAGALWVDGVLDKASGSFKIDHPLEAKKDTHWLRHSFLEGPQADLIYRGTVDLSGGTATVNIDTEARMTDGTFVALNGNVQAFTSNETGWDAVRGSVSGNVLTIESNNDASTDTISWMVVGERKDEHMLDTDWTDSDGRVITESEKDVLTPFDEDNGEE